MPKSCHLNHRVLNLYNRRFSRLLSDGDEVFVDRRRRRRRRRRHEPLRRDRHRRNLVAVERERKGQVERLVEVLENFLYFVNDRQVK
jgi:hypothetical protein